jgi:hypothetical protein
MESIYRIFHKSGAIGELGYLGKYGKMKEGNVVANHVFPISSVRILHLGQAVMALCYFSVCKFFRILPNNRVLIWPRSCGTPVYILSELRINSTFKRKYPPAQAHSCSNTWYRNIGWHSVVHQFFTVLVFHLIFGFLVFHSLYRI